LTSTGREQAEAVAQRFQAVGVHFDHIYTSDLLRTRQTAEIIAAHQPIGVSEITPMLREHDSGMEEQRGQEAWDALNKLIMQWFVEGDAEARINDGENLLEFRGRVMEFIDLVAERHGTSDDTILIVSHAGVLMTVMPFLLENVDLVFIRDNELENAAVIVAEYNGSKWYGIKWQDVNLNQPGES
jgi:broad specificity phosphatase PhoE